MFPHIMIVAALVFFPAPFHQKIIDRIRIWFRINTNQINQANNAPNSKLIYRFFIVFFCVQLLFPFRYLAYPGELFWTEQGYRFSWRVMLMEKAGYAQFTIKDKSGQQLVINNSEFLTPLQEKMMSTQPDLILQYAQLLRNHYNKQGFNNAEVYVDSYVALNGRLGKPLVAPTTNLAMLKESFQTKTWITPLNAEIKGF
jgi:hypothetical protein